MGTSRRATGAPPGPGAAVSSGTMIQADASSVLDAEGARCYSQTVMEGLTYEQMTDVEGTAFEGDAFQEKLQAAFEACR